jgi:hypothetical protein
MGEPVQLVNHSNAWSAFSAVPGVVRLEVVPMAQDGLLINVKEKIDLME